MPLGELLALAAAMLFGFSSVLVRKGMASKVKAPDNGMFFTTVINTVVFTVAVAVLAVAQGLPPITWTGIGAFVVAGVLTTFLGRVTHFAGISYLGPSRASGFRVTAPIFAFAIAFALLDERLGALQMAGILITVLGLYLLSGDANRSARLRRRDAGHDASVYANNYGWRGLERTVLVGSAMALLSAIFFATGQTMRKFSLQIIPSPVLGAMIGSLVAASSVTATFGLRGELSQVLRANFAPVRWWFALAGLLMCGGQLSLFGGVYYAKVASVSTIYATEPVFTMLFAWAFLGREEKITWVTAISIILVVSGVILVVQGS